jgi:hypothetical protein
MFRKRDTGEDEERQRQAKERAALSLNDQLYGPKKLTAAGTPSLQHRRRTGNVLQFNARIRPKLRHMIVALMNRDGVPSLPVMIEAMLDAYQRIHGALNEGDIPSDAEIIAMFLKEEEKRLGKGITDDDDDNDDRK